MASFDATYPAPAADTATAQQVSGWFAAHALWLLGRATRRRELHGPADSTYLHLLDISAAETQIAYLMWACTTDGDADETARSLMAAVQYGDDYAVCTGNIAYSGGYDPVKARRSGYES